MAVSLDQFSKQLADSGVMTDSDLQAFIETLPADVRPTDGEQLAKRLVREKKISAYQAQVVYSGKGKSLTLGSYSVIDKLGQGGMGMVLKAEHRVMKRLVALKVLSPAVTKTKDAVLRFQREVEAAARLTHPNIVAAFDAGEANGTSFLVMEYVPGTDLSSLVKDKGPLPVHQAIDCIIQAARGLEFAHANGVIHRDIKPANLLLDTTGTVKVLDMGLARIEASDAATQAELTGTGAVMGTVDYMAPEQALSTKHADAKSDIYSLGISLWYLLTAKSTYEGDSLMARLLAHRDQPIPSLRDARAEASEELEAVFRRMVAKKPAERYQTATEVITDLQACRTGGSVSAMVMAEEESSSVDDFKAFLQGLEGTTHSLGGPKPKASLTATQTLSKHSLSHIDETIPPRGSSDTLNSRRKKKGPPKSPPWFQDLRALIGGGVAAVLLLFAVVLLFQSPNGTLRVQILDSEVEVKVQGTTVTLRGAEAEPISLKAGDKKLLVTRGKVSLETEAFAIKRGRETLVTVDLAVNSLTVKSDGRILGEKAVPRKNITISSTGEKAVGAVIETTSPKPSGDYALKFEPPDSYVDIPPPPKPESAECTCELWFTPHGYIPGNTAFYLLTGSHGELTIAEDKFRFYTFHGHAQSPTLYKQNQRVHLAGVNDTNRRLLYLNGKLIATTDDAGHPSPSNDLQPVRIGGGTFAGLVDAVRISRVARYNKNFIPPARFTSDKDTVALYRFDEGQGDILKDSSGNNHHGKIVGAKWVMADGEAITTPPQTGPTVDLLAVIDPQRDPWTGEWRREEKFLLSDNLGKPGRVQIRHPVPDEYELTAVIERLDSDDGFQFGLVVGGRPVVFLIDSFVPHITGLGLLDGKEPNDNVTTLHRILLTNNRQYTVVITVGKRSVSATLDGEQILAWEGDPQRLSLAGYEQTPDPTQFWIGTAYITARFHKLELRTRAESAAASDIVYLDDLQETSWKDGYMRLGKHNLEYNGWKYTWRGKEPAHALVTHPVPNKTASVSYQLDGKYETFTALTGIADVTEVGSKNPLMLRVLGDGRELWKSPPLQKLTDEAAISVSVKGVNELKLEVSCGDDNYKALAVWFEPRLSRASRSQPIGTLGSLTEFLTSTDYEWTTPENLGPGVNGPHFDEQPELMADGLRLWFSGGGEIWMSTRATLDSPFGKRVNAGGQINDGASWDSEPTLSADRLSLVFSSDRGTDKRDVNLWMCSKATFGKPFNRPVKLGDDVNSPDWETCPALSADGLTLIFASSRPGGRGDFDLWQATRADTASDFGNVTNLGPIVNSPQRDSGAYLSSDGLVLLLESTHRGGAGKNDLYLSTRSTRDASFGKPISLGNSVNTSDDEQAPCLSADGRTLMFYSNRPGGHGEADLWMSRRVRK